tara:strand:- start:258 stop:443 length:186 start_codon:yes stop_codon:yes gene_type:complete
MKPNTRAKPDFSYYLTQNAIKEKLVKLETDYRSVLRVKYVKKSTANGVGDKIAEFGGNANA